MEQRLFKTSEQPPLAERLRPRDLEAFAGQRHLVGEQGPLRTAPLHSMILWGPPGCGKTTLAHLLARRADAEFEVLSPVSAGVKEVKLCVASARQRREDHDRATVLFVDEVHRFNKSQQDYFLPHVESGLLTLLGATTENPSFEVNSALLSRLVVYRLDRLGEEDLHKILAAALGAAQVSMAVEAQAALLAAADGDARQLLNMFEQLAAASDAITIDDVERLALSMTRRFDKGGDDFYDQISALIKSVRGSNPDAALYWLCRMLDGGARPEYLARRIIRLATEDIGLADPQALSVAMDADEQYRRLGSPEGELGLAMAVVYLACAPKSNAIYMAYKEAMDAVKRHGSLEVPLHLRNAPTRLMKSMGNAKGYRYAHDEPHGYAAGERYLPEDLASLAAYRPTSRGFEERVAKRLAALRELDRKAQARNDDGYNSNADTD